MLKFLQKLALDFPYICLQFFPEIFHLSLILDPFTIKITDKFPHFETKKELRKLAKIYIYFLSYKVKLNVSGKNLDWILVELLARASGAP